MDGTSKDLENGIREMDENIEESLRAIKAYNARISEAYEGIDKYLEFKPKNDTQKKMKKEALNSLSEIINKCKLKILKWEEYEAKWSKLRQEGIEVLEQCKELGIE